MRNGALEENEMAEYSDEELVSIYRETGEPSCFDQLVARHIGQVRAVVLGMVCVDADADDLTQEIFVKAARSINRFRGEAQFKTWLYRIMMNTTKNFLRSRTNRAKVFGDAGEDLPEGVSECSDRPDRRLIAQETGRHLDAALASLPTQFRSAIVLTVLEQVEVSEAAQIENCSKATMYWRIHKARRLMREALYQRGANQ